MLQKSFYRLTLTGSNMPLIIITTLPRSTCMNPPVALIATQTWMLVRTTSRIFKEVDQAIRQQWAAILASCLKYASLPSQPLQSMTSQQTIIVWTRATTLWLNRTTTIRCTIQLALILPSDNLPCTTVSICLRIRVTCFLCVIQPHRIGTRYGLLIRPRSLQAALPAVTMLTTAKQLIRRIWSNSWQQEIRQGPHR